MHAYRFLKTLTWQSVDWSYDLQGIYVNIIETYNETTDIALLTKQMGVVSVTNDHLLNKQGMISFIQKLQVVESQCYFVDDQTIFTEERKYITKYYKYF